MDETAPSTGISSSGDPGESVLLDARIARRLRELRIGRGWTLDDLARTSGVSRATLSRLEKGEVGPTTAVLGRLCTAHGMTLSRLLLMVEGECPAKIERAAQAVWTDPANGFRRRSVSPPDATLAGEVVACDLPPGTTIAYDAPPRPGLEHHLVLQTGRLVVTVDGARHDLRPGDCLRYRLHGASLFETPADAGAAYLLFLV